MIAVASVLVAFFFWASRPRYYHHGGRVSGDVIGIISSLSEYAIDNNGAYPDSLEALVIPDQNGHCYLEGYNGKLPKDPWKHEYQYAAPTPAHPRPRVWSCGADGKPGGSGDDADIDSDELASEH